MNTMFNKAFSMFRAVPANEVVMSLCDQDTFQGESQFEQSLIERLFWEGGQVTRAAENEYSSLILKFVSSIVVNETQNPFVAKENFVVNTETEAPVRISYLGYNFKSWFLSGDGKIEDPIKKGPLYCHELREPLVDNPILSGLGGEIEAETTLSETFFLMMNHKHNERSTLLNNVVTKISYIKDSAGVLRTVFRSWKDGGWSISASSITNPHRWAIGSQVFSRILNAKFSETLMRAQA